MAPTQATTPRPTSTRPQRMLCAYSPRWLSGRIPGYAGLVASFGTPEEDEHEPTDQR